MEPMRFCAALIALPVLVGGCNGGAPDLAPGNLGVPRVASVETANGATPMFAVLPGGGRVLSWVAGEGARAALEVEVTPSGAGLRRRSHLVDTLGGIEPHGEAPPQLAVGPGQTLYALYTVGKDVGARYPASALRFARTTDWGTTWSEPVTVNIGPAFGAHSFHAITAGKDGEVYATWLNNDPAESGVWLRRSADGGLSWDQARRIVEGPACPCCRTAVAVAGTGRVYVAWRGVSTESVRDIQVIHSDDHGATWSAATTPRRDGWVFNGCPHAGPALRVGADDRVHIAWWTGASSGPGVWYAQADADLSSWTPTPIDAARGAPPAHVQMAMREGALAITWEGGRDKLPATFVRVSRDAGRTFSGAEQLSTAGVAATFPVLGLFGDSVLIAWTQVGDSAYRALLEQHREPEGPDERMALPRVGAQEIMMRAGRLDAVGVGR